jgi:outer membrane protein assembly factor BamB
MENHKLSSSIILTILLLSLWFIVTQPANASSTEDQWPMFRHDPTHSGHSDTGSVLTAEPKVLWTAPKGLGGSPVVADGFVYIHDQNYLKCLNASDGTEIWKQRTPLSASEAAPAVYCGYVYTPLCAYNATTGELFLNYTRYNGYGSPVVVEGVLYSGSTSDCNLFALNATTGTKIWAFRTEGRVACSPAVVNGKIYFTSNDGHVYALDTLSGVKVWGFKINGFFYLASPAVVDGRVYVGSSNNLYCLDALSGIKIWNNSMANTASSSPAVAKGYVYVVGSHGNLYALNASTGVQLWKTNKGRFPSSPSVAGGVVYAGDSYGIIAVNASTGTKIWNYTFPEPEYYMPSCPAIMNNVIYCGNYLKLHAFGIQSESQLPIQSDEKTSVSTFFATSEEILPTALIIITVILLIFSGVLVVAHFKKTKR